MSKIVQPILYIQIHQQENASNVQIHVLLVSSAHQTQQIQQYYVLAVMLDMFIKLMDNVFTFALKEHSQTISTTLHNVLLALILALIAISPIQFVLDANQDIFWMLILVNQTIHALVVIMKIH